MSYEIIFLNGEEYSNLFWSLPSPNDWLDVSFWGIESRMFTLGETIYVNSDAYWISRKDYENTLKHEIKHTEGYNHTIFGIMSPLPILRGI